MIHQVVVGFWSSIAGSRHQLVRVWNDGPHVAVQGDVTYTRKDQRQVTIPFVNAFRRATRSPSTSSTWTPLFTA